MKTYKNIIITGSLSWDTIMDFPHRFVDYLQKDKLHQINVSFVVDNLEKQMGGTATNIAYAARQTQEFFENSKLKISHFAQRASKDKQNSKRKLKNQKKTKNTIILGGLGKDGGKHLRFFKKNNIETAGIVVDKTRFSANGTVITDMADNQIWGFYYGACDKGAIADFKRFADENSLLIISANHPRSFMRAQEYAVSNHIDYLYDVGMALSWIKKDKLREGVYKAKWLIGNDYEIGLILKTLHVSEDDVVKHGIDVITTLGEKGVTLATKNYKLQITNHKQITNNKPQRTKIKNEDRRLKIQTIHIPAYEVKKVVDPTGAGDAWRGGFMAAISQGYDIVNSLVIGNAVASFAVEQYGTVNYRIGKEKLLKRIYKITSQMTNHKLQTNYK